MSLFAVGIPNMTDQEQLLNQIAQCIEDQRRKLGAKDNVAMETRVKAHIEYLESISNELANGLDEDALKTKLEEELPRLDEEIAREEAGYTFDWYDDHHYEKIYLGQRDACKDLLTLLR